MKWYMSLLSGVAGAFGYIFVRELIDYIRRREKEGR
jgi:hypothetical protein